MASGGPDTAHATKRSYKGSAVPAARRCSADIPFKGRTYHSKKIPSKNPGPCRFTAVHQRASVRDIFRPRSAESVGGSPRVAERASAALALGFPRASRSHADPICLPEHSGVGNIAEPDEKAVLQRARELRERAGYKDPFDFTADAKGTSFLSARRPQQFIAKARAELGGEAANDA